MAANESRLLVEGILAGLEVSTNITTDECITSGLNYKNLEDHDWSTLISWEHNSVKDIP